MNAEHRGAVMHRTIAPSRQTHDVSRFARSDKLRLCRAGTPAVALFSLKVAFAGSRRSNGGVLLAADTSETRHGVGIDTAYQLGNPSSGSLALAVSERAH